MTQLKESMPPEPFPDRDYPLPPWDLLAGSAATGEESQIAIARRKADELSLLLKTHGVGAEVVQIDTGLASTFYEVAVDPNASGRMILAMTDDLERRLAHESVRRVVPIPREEYHRH